MAGRDQPEHIPPTFLRGISAHQRSKGHRFPSNFKNTQEVQKDIQRYLAAGTFLPTRTKKCLPVGPSKNETEAPVPRGDGDNLIAQWTSDNKPKRGRGGRARGRGGRGRDSRQARTVIEIPDWDNPWDQRTEDWNKDDSAEARRKLADLGLQLSGWDDHWSPAPLEWDSRAAFRDYQKETYIWKWLGPVSLNLTPAIDLQGREAAEMVPWEWIPDFLNQPLNQFWEEYINSDFVLPFDHGDMANVRPFWKTYENRTSIFINPYQHPSIPDTSPHETLAERIARRTDRGNLTHQTNTRKYQRALKSAVRDQQSKLQAHQDRLVEVHGPDYHAPIIPRAKIYVRRARAKEMATIAKIYNLGITATTHGVGATRFDGPRMKQFWHTIVSGGSHFLVALEHAPHDLRGQSHTQPANAIVHDQIVGLTYALPGDGNSSFEIQTMTRHDRTRKRIAMCLLDKLVDLLDPSYVAKNGYEDRTPATAGDQVVAQANVGKTMVVTIPFADQVRLEGFEAWLVGFMGFAHREDVEGTEFGLGKGLKVARFERVIGTQITKTTD